MELLERDDALRTLADALREAAGGDCRIALMSGEAGIGKTVLMGGFLAAHRAEARTLLAGAMRCSPRSRWDCCTMSRCRWAAPCSS